MRKFDIQDRVVLDEMMDVFTKIVHQEYDNMEDKGKRLIITREYYLYMIERVQNKIDEFTTKRALSHSKTHR